MPKKSKDQIAESISYELKILGVTDKHALGLAKKWLVSKWSPVVEDFFACSMLYIHWAKSNTEWTEDLSKGMLVIENTLSGLVITINGHKIARDAVDQAWQDRLGKMSQGKVNEALGTPSLFEMSDYDAKEVEDSTSIYTHEEG